MSFATVFGILGRMQSAPVRLRASSRFGGVARSHARAARALARSPAARFARRNWRACCQATRLPPSKAGLGYQDSSLECGRGASVTPARAARKRLLRLIIIHQKYFPDSDWLKAHA